jgi:phage tail P2-like protein
MTSLQPSNATPVELALEHAVALITEIPNPIDTLWDPWKCPVAFLPWVAWQYSVDYWRPEWPEQIKRQVIDAAYEVHRIKGTLPAIKRAIEGLGIESEIVRWFETDPPGAPYTMSVTAWAKPASDTNIVLDAAGQDDLREVIEATKALRTDFALRIGAGYSAATAIAGGLASLQRISVGMSAPAGAGAQLVVADALHLAPITRSRMAVQ